MVMVNCSQQLLASIPLLRQALSALATLSFSNGGQESSLPAASAVSAA
jgi:hypothetical protein